MVARTLSRETQGERNKINSPEMQLGLRPRVGRLTHSPTVPLSPSFREGVGGPQTPDPSNLWPRLTSGDLRLIFYLYLSANTH